MSRELTSEGGGFRVYRVRDSGGALVGTDVEQIATPAETNANTIRDRARTALAANATFLALGAPSNAQVVAQVKALTRQVSGLTRLTLAQTDDIADS